MKLASRFPLLVVGVGLLLPYTPSNLVEDINAQKNLINYVQDRGASSSEETFFATEEEPIECPGLVEEDLPPLKRDGILLALFTMPMDTESSSKTLLQWNALKTLKLLEGKVAVTVFTENPEWKDVAKSFDFKVEEYPQKSLNGTPIITAAFHRVSQLYPAVPFIGYANGDLLFSHDLLVTLEMILERINVDKLSNKTMIVGRRTQLDFKKMMSTIRSSNLEDVSKLRNKGRYGPQDAQDYFIFYQEGMFPWQKLPPFAVGRIGYDNWLVLHARDENYDVVDASRTITCIHQTASDGNFASRTKMTDKFYNYQLINEKDQQRFKEGHGKINVNANWITSWSAKNVHIAQFKYTPSGRKSSKKPAQKNVKTPHVKSTKSGNEENRSSS